MHLFNFIELPIYVFYTAIRHKHHMSALINGQTTMECRFDCEYIGTFGCQVGQGYIVLIRFDASNLLKCVYRRHVYSILFSNQLSGIMYISFSTFFSLRWNISILCNCLFLRSSTILNFFQHFIQNSKQIPYFFLSLIYFVIIFQYV